MTANVSLNQSVHLRQAASDYLSQTYQISFKLDKLIKSLTELFLLIQNYKKSLHNLLDKKLILVKYFEDISFFQRIRIKQFRQVNT